MEQASKEDVNKYCAVGQWCTVTISEHRGLVGTAHNMSDRHTYLRSRHIESGIGL